MRLAISAFVFALAIGEGSALAADVMVPMPLDWTGFYVGAQAGGAISRPNEKGSSDLPSSDTEITGGVNAQALYEMDQFVFGTIVDGNLSTALASQACTSNTALTCKDGSGGDFSVRAKLGYAFDNVLLYGTGGWGWADYQMKSFKTSDGSGAFSDQRLLNGWVAGAGLSYAINEKWITSVEYLHYDLGSSNSYTGTGLETVAPTMDTVTMGIGYKF